MLPVIGAGRAPASAYADENTDFPPRPLVDSRLVQNLRRWVIGPRALIGEDMLSNLNRFECEARGACCPARLPNSAIELGRGFFSRVVRSQKNVRALSRAAFVHSGDGTGVSKLAFKAISSLRNKGGKKGSGINWVDTLN